MPATRWRAILAEIRRADLTDTAQKVTARTLIIAGVLDPLFSDTHQEALSRSLSGASLVRAEKCGHNPHWEDPAFVAEVIDRTFRSG